MTLQELLGQTLVFGIPGTRVRPEDIRLFRETHAGGLILYRVNFESPAQIKKLISDLENALGRRLLVAVDHEGGRVVMFGRGVTTFPAPLAFGRANRPGWVRRQGRIEARELRRLGIDVNFAPVADVLKEDSYIGLRSYGPNPRRVAQMVSARVRGMQEEGLSACAKHFPGLGPARLDPHLDLPVIRASWSDVRKRHAPLFQKAIRAGVDVIMSSHPLYPRLDRTPNTPATFSRKIIHDFLRRQLRFKGVVASDDLEMGALKNICSVGCAAVRAAAAGHDLLLVCHNARAQKDAFTSLHKAYRNGELSVPSLAMSVERIQRLRRRRPLRFSPGKPRAEKKGARLVRLLAQKLGPRGHSVVVDLGGTHVRASAFDIEGRLVWREAAPAPPPERLEKFLNILWRKKHMPRPLLLTVGSKGVWSPEQKREMAGRLKNLAEYVEVLSDVELAHRNVFGRYGNGIVLVAGTGSIAYGRNAARKIARAGGRGPRRGDAGSAFWIGREYLRKSGRPIPPLTPEGVARTASLAPLALKHNPAIEREAQAHLAGLVRAVQNKLRLKLPLPLALHGGLFSNKRFRRGFVARWGARVGFRPD